MGTSVSRRRSRADSAGGRSIDRPSLPGRSSDYSVDCQRSASMCRRVKIEAAVLPDSIRDLMDYAGGYYADGMGWAIESNRGRRLFDSLDEQGFPQIGPRH